MKLPSEVWGKIGRQLTQDGEDLRHAGQLIEAGDNYNGVPLYLSVKRRLSVLEHQVEEIGRRETFQAGVASIVSAIAGLRR